MALTCRRIQSSLSNFLLQCVPQTGLLASMSIPPFNRYLLNMSYMPGTVVHPWRVSGTTIAKYLTLHRAYILKGQICKTMQTL